METGHLSTRVVETGLKTCLDSVKVDMRNFHLSRENARVWNKWKREIKGLQANPGSAGRWHVMSLCDQRVTYHSH